MTHCNTQLTFPFFRKKTLTATFNGGDVVSDAGLLLVREFDDRIGFTESLARLIPDPRFLPMVMHPHQELFRQRFYQLLAGYEDADDSDVLRHNALFKLLANRRPQDDPLASQPTVSRLENRVPHSTCWELVEELVRIFIRTRRTPPKLIVLDMDPSSAATHGHQQLTFFNAFYDTHMYFPMFLCDAETGYLLAAVLRAGNAGGAEGVFRILARVVEMLRAAWPGLRIEFRADSGFENPDLLNWLEEEHILYAIGMGPNAVLRRLSGPFVQAVEENFRRTGKPQRSFTTLSYAADTWNRARRMVVKCEVTEMGTNVRYVVATRRGPSAKVYDWYVQRGGTVENVIGELKNGFEGDRLSCHEFEANWFRLLLAAATYNLMILFREHTQVPELQTAQIKTVRAKLLKVGARIRETSRRIWVELSSTWPFEPLFRRVYTSLAVVPDG